MTRCMRNVPWMLLLLSLSAGAAESVKSEFNAAMRAKPNADHGAGLFAQCVACHGEQGNGDPNGSTPRIAGQHFRVLAKQLVDYRHGKRWDFRMEGMAGRHHLAGPQDIADVAAYVAKLPRQGTPGVGDGELVAKGSGIYSANCKSCHGRDAEGDAARGIPRLAGQHYAYLMRQMYDAVDGRRPTLPQLHSERIAPLDFEQVRAVSDFLARIEAPSQP